MIKSFIDSLLNILSRRKFLKIFILYVVRKLTAQ